MPTDDRRCFVPSAIRLFKAQRYPNKELIIIDDGTDSIQDLVSGSDSIRYVRLKRRESIGAKRNIACSVADGELILHWDDDDWYASWRIEYQVSAMLDSGADLCGIDRAFFFDPGQDTAWEYVYPRSSRQWLCGAALCYRKAFWETHRFAEINSGEDTRFVFGASLERIAVLSDSTFFVGRIHERNTSPKRTSGPRWSKYDSKVLAGIVGERCLDFLNGAFVTNISTGQTGSGIKAAARVGGAQSARNTNVYACLVHESPACVADLLANLRHHDSDSEIILYNGGHDRHATPTANELDIYNARAHPNPTPLRWGYLHRFAIDCMRLALSSLDFNFITIVDSDELCVRGGYPEYISAYLMERGAVGMLGVTSSPEPDSTAQGPARAAWRERHLWRRFLSQFPDGEEKFPHWTFWPSTVFTRNAAEALVDRFDNDRELMNVMRRSRIWATEEVVLPSLVSLLGFEIAINPCSYDFVKHKVSYTASDLSSALKNRNVYWMHPVPRDYSDPLREIVRKHFGYQPRVAERPPLPGSPRLGITASLVRRARSIRGCLEDEAAEFLVNATFAAVEGAVRVPPVRIVEIGSYCGRATVLMGAVARYTCPDFTIFALDDYECTTEVPNDLGQPVIPNLELFKRNVRRHGLASFIKPCVGHPSDFTWDEPICLILMDGAPDYESIKGDFDAVKNALILGGYLAFSNYTPYSSGVVRVVNDLLEEGRYKHVDTRGSLCLLQRLN